MMKPRHEHKGTATRYRAENKNLSGRPLEPELRKPCGDPQTWEEPSPATIHAAQASLLWV